MTDIIIRKHRDRIIITSQSYLGKRWIIENIEGKEPIVVSSEHLEDFIEQLRKDGMSVEY